MTRYDTVKFQGCSFALPLSTLQLLPVYIVVFSINPFPSHSLSHASHLHHLFPVGKWIVLPEYNSGVITHSAHVRPAWRCVRKKRYYRRNKYIHLSNVETIIIVIRFLSIGDMLLIGINKRRSRREQWLNSINWTVHWRGDALHARAAVSQKRLRVCIHHFY